MPRLTLILTGLIAALALASPASAEVLTATRADPAERAGDPGRDIQSFSTTYDPAGAWRVAVRFYGAPTADTSALLRVYLGERAADGSCESDYPNVGLAVWTDPADKGGKASFQDGSVNVVKTLDGDSQGFGVEIADARLAGRAVCGVGTVTLSRKEPFDSVPAFALTGASGQPAPGDPADPTQPGQPGQPAQPAADTTPPSARVMILRDPKAARRGIVRVAVLGASERMLARATLYGPGNVVLSRHGKTIDTGEMLRLTLTLGTKRLAQLKRTGRLPVRVVTQLVDQASNRTIVRSATTLRSKRS
jgi:hypothetical protein